MKYISIIESMGILLAFSKYNINARVKAIGANDKLF